MQFDREEKFKGYNIYFFCKGENTPVRFRMSEEDFNEYESFLNWMDFLVKTEQWIPYAFYKDVFNMEEQEYKDLKLENVEMMEINYEEYYRRIKDIDLDKRC